MIPNNIKVNSKQQMNGIDLLKNLPNELASVVFFDPQYRGILDKLSYGNEGKNREKRRLSLEQMNEEVIISFIKEIDKILKPSSHLFLWIDKYHLCEGFSHWLKNTKLETVDMIVWDKMRFGMGYRTRRQSEYCIIIQKEPKRAKNVWNIKNIPDVWQEKSIRGGEHPHIKPIELQKKLIEAVSKENDYIIDPSAGSYSVMKAALEINRNFIGCDLN